MISSVVIEQYPAEMIESRIGDDAVDVERPAQ